ncbi:hypothetical protein D3C76_1653220 [compost metagenome]
MQTCNLESLVTGLIAQMTIERFAGTRAVEPCLIQALTDQPAFEVAYQCLAGTPPKPFGLHVTKRYLAADGGHGNANRLVL